MVLAFIVLCLSGHAHSKALSRGRRAVSPSEEGTNQVTACTPSAASVNMTDLLYTFTKLVRQDRPHDPRVQSEVNRLQMFTPLPLEYMACADPDAALCRQLQNRLRSDGADQLVFNHLTKIYPGTTDKVPTGRCSKQHNNPNTICSTDYNRFPPVLCEATCTTPCGCCRQRKNSENNHRSVKTKVKVMEITGCDQQTGTPTWSLRVVRLLPVSPYSCVCA